MQQQQQQLREETDCLSKIKFHHLHKLGGHSLAVGNTERRKNSTESELSLLVSPPVKKAVSFINEGRAVQSVRKWSRSHRAGYNSGLC